MVDITGINFNDSVFAFTADMFTINANGGATDQNGFPTGGDLSGLGQTFQLNSGEAPGVITITAPDTPFLSDTTSANMTAVGTVTSSGGTSVTFDADTIFQAETSWDFVAPDGKTYWIAQLQEGAETLYVSNYSFVPGESLDFLSMDGSPGFEGNLGDSAYGSNLRVDDIATPDAPLQSGSFSYVAWNNDDVTFSISTNTFTIDANADSGEFITRDNDNFFSDGVAEFGSLANDINQIGDASVGATNSFTNEIYQAEEIILLTDPAGGDPIKAILIQSESGSFIWVTTKPIDPGVTYTTTIFDGTPGMDNLNLTDDQEQFARYSQLVAVCFAKGTKITTVEGQIPVEDLKIGDKVLTKDNGAKEILWIGSRTYSADVLKLAEHLKPIRIRKGALGNGQPSQDLVVSPQHRIAIQSKIVERMFDSEEVLVAAKHLLGHSGIEVDHSVREVEYFHFMFDQHEIVYANNTAAESLFAGPEALKTFHPEARAEIFEIFPELKTSKETPKPCRPIVRGKQLRQLFKRHDKNNKVLMG